MNNQNWNKIKHIYERNPHLKGFILSDPATIAMLTGIQLLQLEAMQDQVVYLFASQEERTLICPQQLATTFAAGGWNQNLAVYPASKNPAKAAFACLTAQMGCKVEPEDRIGFEGCHLSIHALNRLKSAFPSISIVDISATLTEIRIVKTKAEIRSLLHAAELTDHGISGAIHHVATNQSRSEKFLSEDIRVHSLERGLDINGYIAVSQAASGEAAKKMWPNQPAFGVGSAAEYQEGNCIRLEMRGLYGGVWSDNSKLMVKGDLTPELKELFTKIAELRHFACSLIQPGAVAHEIHAKLTGKAGELGLRIVPEIGFGHGIGASLVEAPYLSAKDATVIQANMVLILTLPVYGPAEELLISKDTLLVTESGSEIKGWYANWDVPYLTAYTF